MTSDTLLLAIHAHLRVKVVAAGGELDLSETPQATLGLLKAAPTKWRVILQWLREDGIGETFTVSEMRFLAVVQQHRGLGVQAGADVQTSRAGDPALLTRHHQVAAWLRGLRLQHPSVDCRGIFQRSAYWLSDPEFPTRQIAGEYSLAYGLGPTTIEEVNVPIPLVMEDGSAWVTEDGQQLTTE